MVGRLLLKTDRRCLYKFIYNLGIKGVAGFSKFKRRLRRGVFYPAFHFISVTDDCNLNCQGCWATGKNEKKRMDPAVLDRVINESKAMGSYFFGILGGEPLMYKPLFGVFEKHSDCYFQLFTNGTLLDAKAAGELRRLANVSPLISFEGDREVADIRRGGVNVYERTMEAIRQSTGAGLVTGVAISVCKSNLEFATSDKFINSLIKEGVVYLWYYIFRPVGENPAVELSLSEEEVARLRNFLVDARTRFDIMIIDTYWDGDGKGLCPAASGLSHHINASGDIEPCPVIQFAAENISDGKLSDIYDNSGFLGELRTGIAEKTNGCVIMEDPGWLVEFAKRHNASDTSGRGNEYERLAGMPAVPSHGAAPAIRERKWYYRFAKRNAFFGLGAYG